MSNSPSPTRSSSPSSPPSTPPPSVLFVRALHTFSPESLPPDPAEAGTCLSFEQGQIIKCLNQDASGWWDGELEGRRGWFPSNYVEVIASEQANDSPSPRRKRQQTPRKGIDKHSRSRNELTPEANTLLSSIEQNAGLLENAVNRASKGHYQPSTACLISSIRTVLSATQCLTRDSPVLRKHPSLSSSRKHILSSLASLVNQARKASAPEDRGAEIEQQESQEMLRMAKDTVGFVRGFLEEAQRKQVEVNLSLGSSPKLGGGGGDENESSSSIRPVKSLGNLQTRRPTLEALEQPLPVSTFPIRADSPAMLVPPRPSMAPVVLRNPSALTRHLSTLHDALLSTIAALIGHIHSHSRTTSPASSFAQLIDLTREGIERVRDILEVVEAVGGKSSDDDNGLDLKGGDEQDELMKALSLTRERLYLATTTLVTAARIATSPLASSGPTPSRAEEEEERKGLLGAATGVLRSGGDCVGSVKAVGIRLLEGGEGFEIVLAKARRPSEYEADSEDDSESKGTTTNSRFADAPPPALGRIRNAHTLSMLGRKATSLNSLRQRFEKEDTLGEEEEEEEEEEREQQNEEDERESRTSPTGRRKFSPSHTFSSSSSSAPSTITPNLSNDSRSTEMSPTRTSIPMSRNASSGSGSNAGSVISRTTASSIAGTYLTGETSPRSSYGTSSGIKFASGASSSSNGIPPLPSSSNQRPRSSTRPTSGSKSLSSNGRPSLDRIRSESPTIQLNSATSPTTNSSPLSQISSAFLSAPLSPMTSAATSPQTSVDRKTTSSPSAWFLERDYQPQEISFNADGHVTGGTLHVLIERMTLHDTTIDPAFATTFLLTFRLFTSPSELISQLYRRFDLAPPRHPDTNEELSPEEMKQWTSIKLTPIRLRIYNLIKTWLESHWQHDADQGIVDGLREWSNGRLKAAMPAASSRMLDLIEKRVTAAEQERQSSIELEPRPSNASQSSFVSSNGGFSSNGFNDSSTSLQLPVPQGIQKSLLRMASTDRLKAGKPIIPFSSLSPVLTNFPASPSNPSSPTVDSYSPSSPTAAQAPTPIVSKSLLAMLRSPSGRYPSVTDVDTLELARQLTIMESRVYCSIRPEELLGSPSSSSNGSAKREGSVRKMSALSTRLTGWIAETILGETDQKKRTALVKYFVKLGERLLMLNNYNALFAVFTALNSSTISRLRKTWDGLAPKYRQSLEVLRRATDHSRNYAEYRGKIRQTVPPCLPFVGLFLTDLIFIFEGNRAERSSPIDPSLRLINFDRYQKMSRIIGDLQRFQVPYTLVEVPELQSLLSTMLEGPLKHGQDAQSLYRQSLMIEPRSNAASTKSGSTTTEGGGRSKDVFNWRS
ncbi:guanine nucleotide exchange factor [Sporobolomyces salmoneus]|uniref:guanine nucleotide exchange factor n=1 Tax=Sporobolomyces salmoneus TaxID=183962 RepID=UPI00317FE5C2